jgi:ABC-type spermidine/putrescine transport system permease subunit II
MENSNSSEMPWWQHLRKLFLAYLAFAIAGGVLTFFVFLVGKPAVGFFLGLAIGLPAGLFGARFLSNRGFPGRRFLGPLLSR